jgi:hypothetical protein
LVVSIRGKRLDQGRAGEAHITAAVSVVLHCEKMVVGSGSGVIVASNIPVFVAAWTDAVKAATPARRNLRDGMAINSGFGR